MNPIAFHHPLVRSFAESDYGAGDLARLKRQLLDAGTFHFPQFPNGLFPAANLKKGDKTGYANVWIRDTVHVAHALWVDGRTDEATRPIGALAEYLRKYLHRFTDIIAGKVDPSDPMNRPHIRFSGPDLAENAEKWAHAQNDALGYFLWLYCKLARAAPANSPPPDGRLLAAFPLYFDAIGYETDEDSGHWEETRKVSASSIGVVIAGLVELEKLVLERRVELEPLEGRSVGPESIRSLIERGERALAAMLPAECVQADSQKARGADAALLFLLEPLGLIGGPAADAILASAQTLEGEVGVRRYHGDSYWCADYKEKLAEDERTADFSDALGRRDALLVPGEEAQWCLFDPILSVIHGRRFERTGSAQALARQRHYFHRSLAHLTAPDSSFGPLRCPESYYLERGARVPNDASPLLWTQANLLLAWRQLEKSLARDPAVTPAD